MLPAWPCTLHQTHQFNDIFSLRKPKDAKAGLSSGLKSIAKGCLGGFMALVASPVIGGCTNGFKGACAGFLAGKRESLSLPFSLSLSLSLCLSLSLSLSLCILMPRSKD